MTEQQINYQALYEAEIERVGEEDWRAFRDRVASDARAELEAFGLQHDFGPNGVDRSEP